MRDLSALKNVIEIRDAVSGDVHELHYRLPTTSERAAYQASLLARKGGKIVSRVFQSRVEFAGRILTGFAKGSFACSGRLIASDPADPDYLPDWKDMLTAACPEILAVLGQVAFEGASQAGSGYGSAADIEVEAADAPLA